MGNFPKQRQLAEKAIEKFPSHEKFYLLLGELHEHLQHLQDARQVYQKGLKHSPNSVPLWMAYAALELKTSASRARAVCEKARLKNPKQPQLWAYAVQVELAAESTETAKTLLSKAIQECPDSGLLRAMSIEMAPKPQKKAISYDALNRCNDDPHVVLAVAKLFWAERNKKTKQWLERATLDSKFGDAWAYRYKYLLVHGSEKEITELEEACDKAKPKQGDLWKPVKRDISNIKLKPSQIMKIVAQKIDI